MEGTSTEDLEAPPAYTSNNDNNNYSNNHQSRRPTRRKKTIGKRLLKLVKSLGGQAALLLAYTFLGAWVMMTLEGPREDSQRKEVSTDRERTAAVLRNVTVALQAGEINMTEWDRQARLTLLTFEEQVHQHGASSTSKKKWTFFGAVLFCVTTYTTIGYGNIAPATKAGRIATMLYATLGIPLALIILADLGRRFAIAFKFIWGFVRRYYYTGYCRKVRDRVSKASYDMTSSYAKDCEPERSAGGIDSKRPGSYRKADKNTNHSNTCYREEREVGAGDRHDGNGDDSTSTKKETENKLAVEDTASSVGQKSPTEAPRSKSDVNHVDQTRKLEIVAIPNKSCEDAGVLTRQEKKSGRKKMEDTESVEEEFKLPVPVAIGFIFAYIFLGAGMYKLWEDWSYLDSFYFVFITTSTIGFGDVLPEHPNFFLLSCVYTFLGLALVSMTVNVIVDFMTKTMDQAKQSVDTAKEKAVAKAKAAKGMLSQVSSRAKNKVRKTISGGHRGKRKKAKRSTASKGIEDRRSSAHSDSDPDRADIPYIHVSETRETALGLSQSDNTTVNDVGPHSHTDKNDGADGKPPCETVSPCVEADNPTANNDCR